MPPLPGTLRRLRRDTAPETPPPRPVCRRCLRPESVCYCAALVSIDTATRVVILQHPREDGMPIGTARMAALCLPRAELHVGVRWEGSAALRDATSDPARPAVLLYPGPDARDVLADPPRGPVTLVVVDGTWAQAKTVVRDNPSLAALPRYAFRPPEPSAYRIRREPRFECVSTIEALAYALGAIEGDPERFRPLLGTMRTMIDRHLAAEARSERPRSVRPRVRPGPGAYVPPEVRERWDDLVCVVGEANAWPSREAPRGIRHELVHWVALRPSLGATFGATFGATGETFDLVAAPEAALAPRTTSLTGLGEDRLRAGLPRAEVVAAWTRFLRPSDVVCSWGHYGPRLLAEAGGAWPAHHVDLRAAARVLSRSKIGSLEQFAARIDPAAAARTDGPRAVRRAGLLVAIVRAWRELPE